MPTSGDFEECFWLQPHNLEPRKFSCGYCGLHVSSDKGYAIVSTRSRDVQLGGVFLCSQCFGPNYFAPDEDTQVPGSAFGHAVLHVPKELNKLFEEARSSTSANCYNGAVLLCRKILMHIAVEQGAAENLNFTQYVGYLADMGFVPPNGKHWVDHIRKKGNEANHEIVIMAAADAEELIVFLEMLLKFIYEFPKSIPNPTSAP